MAGSTKNVGVAHAYARALLELAAAQNAAEMIGDELTALADIVRKDPLLRAFLGNPAIGGAEREQMLKTVFLGRVSPLLSNFLGVLNANRRLDQLPSIATTYAHLLDELVGKVRVDLTVATKLDAGLLAQVREGISRALNKQAIVTEHVDDKIIGGMVVRVEDRLLDGSVKTQLDQMKKDLLTAARG